MFSNERTIDERVRVLACIASGAHDSGDEVEEEFLRQFYWGVLVLADDYKVSLDFIVDALWDDAQLAGGDEIGVSSGSNGLSFDVGLYESDERSGVDEEYDPGVPTVEEVGKNLVLSSQIDGNGTSLLEVPISRGDSLGGRISDARGRDSQSTSISGRKHVVVNSSSKEMQHEGGSSVEQVALRRLMSGYEDHLRVDSTGAVVIYEPSESSAASSSLSAWRFKGILSEVLYHDEGLRSKSAMVSYIYNKMDTAVGFEIDEWAIQLSLVKDQIP